MGRVRYVHVCAEKPTGSVNSAFISVSKAQPGLVNRHTELPACELFLVFPLVTLREAPPSVQVQRGAGPGAVTPFPGFETQLKRRRNASRKQDKAQGTTLPRCPGSHLSRRPPVTGALMCPNDEAHEKRSTLSRSP